MKTFRRYLLSYLGTLLLPITILSAIIFQIVMNDCGAQLLERNVGALGQLSAAVAMQVQQLDAYTLQTTQRSEFFVRNLEKTGAFYDVRRALSQWMMSSTFVRAFYFHNTALETVYAYDSLCPKRAFYAYKLGDSGLDEASVSQMLSAEESGAWLSSQPYAGTAGKLLYASSARVTYAQRSALICEIDQRALETLIKSAMLYTECATMICRADGTPLYVYAPTANLRAEDIEGILGLKENTGTLRVGGTPMLYARLSAGADGLVYVNVVPRAVAYAPISRLWGMFFAGLLLIFALGGTAIAFVMRVNYVPIRKLERDALMADVLTERSDDAVLNVRNALQAMRQSNTAIVRRTEALAKERLILKLLIGGYNSAVSFNAEGAPLALQLLGDVWHIVLVCGEGAGCEAEDFAARLVEAARVALGAHGTPLYLEVPENHSVVFIVPGAGDEKEAEELACRLAETGLDARATASAPCTRLPELAAAYARLLCPEAPRDPKPALYPYPRELYEAVRNALEFGEEERVQFAISGFIGALPEIARHADVRCVGYDMLHLAQGWMEQQDDGEGALAVRALCPRLFSVDGVGRLAAAEQVLRCLGALLAERMQRKAARGNPLVQDIEDYLAMNYRDEGFTVQQAADHFNLSISNLSHYFKNHVGISVSDYVEGLRIEAARALLIKTRMSVADIARAVGYAQPATFMRAFKKVSGQSPTGYRNAGGRAD